MDARLRDGGPRVSARLWQLGSYWSFAVAMTFLALFLLGLAAARSVGADVDSDRSAVGPFLIRLPLVTMAAMLALAVCAAAVRPALARERALGYTTLPFSDLPVEVRDWRRGAILRNASAEPLRRRADLRTRLRTVRLSAPPDRTVRPSHALGAHDGEADR